jgi:tetratricopeptide (TPR) repeat protein
MKKSNKAPKPARVEKANKKNLVHTDHSFTIVAVTLSLFIVGALSAASYVRNSIYLTHVSLWAEVARTAPNKRRAHENYGQALSSAGNYTEALKELKTVQALKDDGSVPLRDLYRELGVVYFRMGMFEESISNWQTGLRHAPYDPSLLNNLSIAFMQMGRFEEAAATAQQALVGSPGMPQALNTMGQISLQKKDYEKAVSYFLQAMEREPDVPARYWNAALALENAKKYEQAYEYASRYAAMEPDPAGRQRAAGFMEHLKQVMGR